MGAGSTDMDATAAPAGGKVAPLPDMVNRKKVAKPKTESLKINVRSEFPETWLWTEDQIEYVMFDVKNVLEALLK